MIDSLTPTKQITSNLTKTDILISPPPLRTSVRHLVAYCHGIIPKYYKTL